MIGAVWAKDANGKGVYKVKIGGERRRFTKRGLQRRSRKGGLQRRSRKGFYKRGLQKKKV